MSKQVNLTVTPLFDLPEKGDEEKQQNYHHAILRSLKKMLPADYFDEKGSENETHTYQKKILQELVPLIACSELHHFPGTLSFFALFPTRNNCFKFFFEMITRWLLPGKRVNVVMIYAADFRLKELGDDVLTLCEVMIHVETHEEYEEIQRHFPIISAEIAVGITSEFYAQRILEVKGLAIDDKTSRIQGLIAFLAKRFPHTYDNHVFTEMQHILVTCRDDFKAARQPRHLSRIISIQYLFRKDLREAMRKNGQRRHLSLKIFRSRLETPQGNKRVLSLLAGVNFIREQETFGEEHILRAVTHYIPTIQLVTNSSFMHKSENICIIYLELEKNDGTEFTDADIRKLRKDLPSNLMSRIEHKLHPVFMPRNEEEIMRNMLSLSNQIKYLRDIPQIIISFDEQTYSHLFFTIILARVLKDDSHRISELFKNGSQSVEYVHDRTKIMGYLRKKYPKEATVFHLKISKESFLRADHSIDLYKARQKVLGEVSRVVGEVRDYNGGMISKEQELLAEVKRKLSDIKEYDEWLLENFFYSLAPLVIRALLDPRAFKILFLMMLEGLKEYKHGDGYFLKESHEGHHTFALIVTEDLLLKDAINHAIQELHIPTTELAYAYTKASGNSCIGYICCSRNDAVKEKFSHTIKQTIDAFEQAKNLLPVS